MTEIQVRDTTGKPIRSFNLEGSVFDSKPNQALVHAAVVMQQAASRQGTASTRGRGEVRGSGRKPWKQKHTGRARAGSSRSPIWRHGGTVFGPLPRDYGYSMPKKMYRAALRSALSSKNSAGEVLVVSELPLSEPKTRHVATFLHQMGLTRKTLIVVGENGVDIFRAARNLPHVKVVNPDELNVYDLLRHDAVLILESAMETIQKFWS